MTKLLLVRHGNTLFEGDNRFWGSTDVGLSETGRAQAALLHERLAAERITTIYTSPLGRAQLTAEAIARGHHTRVVPCAELCECNFGYVEGLTYGEISQRFPGLARDIAERKAVAFPGGESLAQLDKRVHAFLNRLKAVKKGSTVAVISHEGPLRLLVCDLLGLPLEHWYQLRVDRASLSIVETYPSGAILNLLNDISHLKESV